MYTDMINSDVKFDIIDSVRTLGKETRDTLSLFLRSYKIYHCFQLILQR